MRQSNAALSGLFSWTTLAATFESTVAKVFSHLPKVVATTIFLGAASLLITFFVTGKVELERHPAAGPGHRGSSGMRRASSRCW